VEEFAMKRLIGAIAITLAIVAGVGYYLGWFQFSTNQSGEKSNLEITVDKQKIRDDAEAAKKKAEELKDRAKQTIDDAKK
jgi:hypothetical protein